MRRTLVGVGLILHGLAHASLGVWAAPAAPTWLMSLLWVTALVGYVAAGTGMLGVPGLRAVWPYLMLAATVASVALLVAFGHRAFVAGLVIDGAIVVAAIRGALPAIADMSDDATPRHRVWRTAASIAGLGFVAYVGTVAIARPYTMQWGTSADDLARVLPGDSAVPDARYRIDHAITIRAPIDSVWPWIVQMGQDRAGFYSYDWLERLFGARIRNANELRTEWQTRGTGDLVRAVQPDYLGGVFGDSLGWRVTHIDPGRAVVLENWGVFALVPIDSRTTRFIVRTRGAGTPSLANVLFSPLGVFVLEPAHFIMERGMLRGIRARAEGRAGSSSRG